MPNFKISNVEWKRLDIESEAWAGEQCSIKLTLDFAQAPLEEHDDDTIDFTLLALDEEGFAILTVDFYSYSIPKNKKSRVITQRFDCPEDVYQLIDSWELK